MELCCVLSAFRGFIWALRIVNGERTMLLISIAAKSKLIIVVKFSLDVLIKSKDFHWLPSGFTSLLSSPHVLPDFIKVLSTSGLTSYSNRVSFTNKKNAGKKKGKRGEFLVVVVIKSVYSSTWKSTTKWNSLRLEVGKYVKLMLLSNCPFKTMVTTVLLVLRYPQDTFNLFLCI